MSYPGYHGYSGNNGSSANNQGSAYATGRSSSTAGSTPTNPAYPASISQQQYASTAYVWPDRNQSGYAAMNGNLQNYGSTGLKDGHGQQPVYDYNRPQNNYPTSATTDYNRNGWYGGSAQPQAQSGTQALSNLAYASGLNTQEKQTRDDRTSAPRNLDSQAFGSAQPADHGHGRVKSPSHGRSLTSAKARTSQSSQSEQSPTAAHQNLAISAAAALAGAVRRTYNNSPSQSSLNTQQYQPQIPATANTRNQNSANTVGYHHQQRPASSHDTSARGQPQKHNNLPSGDLAQLNHSVSRYETIETHRYAHSGSPHMTLPPPTAIRSLQPESSYGPSQRSGRNDSRPSRSPEKGDLGKVSTTTINSIEASSGMPRQQNPEPTVSMPTFIDPSQVFNPYHKEHERQKREEEERARRASMEVSEPTVGRQGEEVRTNQPVNAAATSTASGSQQQAPSSTNQEAGARPPSRSNSITTEPKEPRDVDMANEMKAMMQRMREWKTKDPSLFQKLWDDMKKGGSGAPAAKGQTPSKSPQLDQVVLQQPPQSQTPQPSQTQTSPAPQMLSDNHRPQPRAASKTSSKPKRHWDLAMVVENNEEGLPDLGRFPAERRNRRASQENAEGKVRKKETKHAAQTPPTIVPQIDGQAEQDERLTWPTQAISQPPRTTNEMSMPVPAQTLPPMSPDGGTIWPEAKRKALAEAAQKALMGLTANKDKSITAAEIHALLEQNPSYIELCAKLEAKGFVFHRGQFARFLLNNVPDLSSPSQPQNKLPQLPVSSGSASSGPAPPPPPPKSSPSEVTAPPATPNGVMQKSHPPPQMPSYANHLLAPASGPKSTPTRTAKPRLGVPSPNIPAPVPGSKEAMARKRDFSELVDLTQLSDDEDYVMPRKQARIEASPEREDFQIKTDISQSNVVSQISGMETHPYGSSNQNLFGPTRGIAPLQFDPQAQTSGLHFRAFAPPPQATPQKSRHLLAKPLNKAEALRKSYYDPKTVARDILIAAGRHPGEHPLNAHLAGLLGKHIDVDSDLSTFDWDTVDPGGPPMPTVQVVDIPAGPPRWKLGQKMRPRSSNIGAPLQPPRIRPVERVETSEPQVVAKNGTENGPTHKTSIGESHGKGNIPIVPTSFARLSSQTKSLLEASFTNIKASHQPTRLRQSQNAADDYSNSNTSPKAVIRKETTPHRTKSIIFLSPSTQNSLKRGPGRPRKSSIIMEDRSLQPPKRRGRPPGSKMKPPATLVKIATKPSSLQVSIPASRRSTSPSQYHIYVCRWRNCDAKLHNLATLRKHIARVHKVSDDEIKGEGQPCWWKNCRTIQDEDEEILPRVTFNSTSDWLDHIESDHLHALGLKYGDGPSSAQTGKPKPFEVSKFFYKPPSMNPVSKARTCSHTDPQTLTLERQIYLGDDQGRAVTAPSTKATIRDYPSDTLVLSSVTMNPESNIPNRAFSKAHGNEKMEIRQSAIETLVALQRHKEKVGPGLDRGGCTLVNAERRATFMDSEGMARIVDADY
jgi:hypothetical protein